MHFYMSLKFTFIAKTFSIPAFMETPYINVVSKDSSLPPLVIVTWLHLSFVWPPYGFSEGHVVASIFGRFYFYTFAIQTYMPLHLSPVTRYAR